MSVPNVFQTIKCIAALTRSEERKKCTELRLQLVHFDVLNYLSQANKYTDTPAETAQYFGMTRGTVSQSLIVLQKKGYLEKTQDKKDKRVIHIKLLPAGKAILNKASRAELFNRATMMLKKDPEIAVQRELFFDVLNAIQKASLSHSFKTGQMQRIELMKNKMLTVFDLVEYMAVLIRSEERKRCATEKIQLVHFQVLEYLSLCNKYSDMPAAIANYLGMTRGTVSQTLILLEKKQLIEKTQDTIDKRVFHIQLLPKGVDLLNNVRGDILFEKAAIILARSLSVIGKEQVFVNALLALQKANNSMSFGLCSSCKNFTKKSESFFCELTLEHLSKADSKKICQEHFPI